MRLTGVVGVGISNPLFYNRGPPRARIHSPEIEMNHSMTDEFVTIQTFGSVVEANFAISRLEAADIDAFIENEYTAWMTPHLASPLGVQVKVRPCDVQKALKLLTSP